MHSLLRVLFIGESGGPTSGFTQGLKSGGFDLITKCVASADQLEAVVRTEAWDCAICNDGLGGFGAIEAFIVLNRVNATFPLFVAVEEQAGPMVVKSILPGADGYFFDNQRRPILAAVERFRHGLSEASAPLVTTEVAGRVGSADESRRLESSLIESEKRSRAQFDHAPDGMILARPAGQLFDVNASLCEFLGHSRDELLSPTVDETVTADTRQHAAASAGGSSKQTSGFSTAAAAIREIPFATSDGREVWVEERSTWITGQDGRRSNRQGVTIDISERKRAEAALIQSEKRYRDLVENALDIVYSHDLEGNYTSVNAAAERLTGYGRDEITSMNMRDLIAPEYLERAQHMIAETVEHPNHPACEIEVIAKDGRRITLEVNTRVEFAEGKPIAFHGIARDITERKLLEEKYRQSQKLEAVGMLAGGISHDFNNLLTAITGYSEITLAKMSPDDPLRANVEQIKNTGERASALTNQLLAFSRKNVLRPVVHNLNSVVRNMDKMLRRIVRENIEFDIELEPDLKNVEADPGQLEQVIVNLAINAQDAMPMGGRLWIKTENVDHPSCASAERCRFVRMTVADSGHGIDTQVLEHIFEPFFTTKEAGKGCGLGLATVHKIVAESGGEITVSSVKGEGTTFEILLPAVDAQAGRLAWEDAEPVDLGGSETVLLVEDDPAVRSLVRDVLSQKGYDVLEAENGEAAIGICRRHSGPIDLLLTDLVMPGMSGIELIGEVLRVHPKIRTMLMTGYAAALPAHNPVLDFHAPLIEKPFTPNRLAEKVREVLSEQATPNSRQRSHASSHLSASGTLSKSR